MKIQVSQLKRFLDQQLTFKAAKCKLLFLPRNHSFNFIRHRVTFLKICLETVLVYISVSGLSFSAPVPHFLNKVLLLALLLLFALKLARMGLVDFQ